MTPERQAEYRYQFEANFPPEEWYEILVEMAKPRVLEKHSQKPEEIIERRQRDSAVRIALAVEEILSGQLTLIAECGQPEGSPDLEEEYNNILRFQLYMISKGIRPERSAYFVLLTPEAIDLYQALDEFQTELDDFVIAEQRNEFDYFDSSVLELVNWGLAYVNYKGQMRLNDFEHDHFKNDLDYQPPFQPEEFEEVVAAAIRARTEPIPRRPKLVQMA